MNSEDAYTTVAVLTEGETESIVTLTWLGADGAGEDLTAYTLALIGKKFGAAAEFTAIAGTKANQVSSPGQVAFDFAPVSSVDGSAGSYLCQMKRTRTVGGLVSHSQEIFQVVVRKSAAEAA